jgi:hypothetical protein
VRRTFCRHIDNCTSGSCGFAHSIEQLSPIECKFGAYCRYFNGSFTCNALHPSETKSDYIKRVYGEHILAKLSHTTTSPVLTDADFPSIIPPTVPPTVPLTVSSSNQDPVQLNPEYQPIPVNEEGIVYCSRKDAVKLMRDMYRTGTHAIIKIID